MPKRHANGFHRHFLLLLLSLLLSSGLVPAVPASSVLAQAAPPHNYGEALQKAIYFYEAQLSGPKPAWSRVEWRGDSGLTDGADVGKNLTGGWYDAGDHVKFGFPMAASTTLLAWGGITYRTGYANSAQLPYLLNNLRWVADYFVKAHTAPNELYGQVGNGSQDHAWWGPAEVMPMARPAYKISASCPGSDLAGETAAALAATSILFRTEGDTAYADSLLTHAEQLYTFADTYRGTYTSCITDASAFYNSWSGYNDELVWGALWLHKAKVAQNAAYGNSYLTKATSYYPTIAGKHIWTHAWDDKSYGSYVLLAQLTGQQQYQDAAQHWLDFWTSNYNGASVTKLADGFPVLDDWGSLRYTANTALAAFIYSDGLPTGHAKKTFYHDKAVNWMNYILGSNPANRSYVVGFGNNPPQHPHHRTAHSSWADSLSVPANHRHVLYGALVGGPNRSGVYNDVIGDYQSNEVATDYNAGFTGALARLVQEFGGTPLATFPVAETHENEIFVEAKVNAAGSNFLEISAYLTNKSGWPARPGDKLSFRYFYTADDSSTVTVSQNYSGCGSNVVSSPQLWSGNIYYVTINCTGTNIYPGGQSAYRKEIQFRLTANGAWNNSNDHSYSGVGTSGTHLLATNIPVYDNGVRVFGTEPGGSSATPTFTPTSTASATVTTVAGNTPTNTPVVATPTPVPPTSTPTATPGGAVAACQVTYTVNNQWGNGFTADVTIKNNGANAINGWQLQWTFAGNQQIVNLWNGALTQSGQSINVANLSYNNGIGANGGVQSFGFQAAFSGSNVNPTTFVLNGLTCNQSANATSTPTAVPPTPVAPTLTPTPLPATATPTATALPPTATPTALPPTATALPPTATPTVALPTSRPTVTPTPAGSGAACQVRYTITSQWPGGFTADVVLKNTGTAPINGWAVTWTFAGNQVITNLWNGALTQTGQTVRVANLSYNTGIGANGGTQQFGFQGTFNGTNVVPTSFTLNGASCGLITAAQAVQSGETAGTGQVIYLPVVTK